MSLVVQKGWCQEDALRLLKRLLNCGYAARWRKLDGCSDRYALLLPLDHNPSLARPLYWDGQVSAACVARGHLPLSFASSVPGDHWLANPGGQMNLPGVR